MDPLERHDWATPFEVRVVFDTISRLELSSEKSESEMKDCEIKSFEEDTKSEYNTNKNINENQVLFTDKLWNEFSNFQYMPIRFKGLITSDLAFATPDGVDRSTHPFFKLFDIAANKDETIEDRFQAIRYMAYIPHQKQVEKSIEAAKIVIFDEGIDIYKRFHFYSTNESYFKLPDWLVHELHKSFFQTGVKLNYPFDLLSLASRYVLGKYTNDTVERQDCLEWLLDVIEDVDEMKAIRAEACDVLVCCGDWDEQEYGKRMLEELGGKDETVYNNSENVHAIDTNSVRAMVRELRSKYYTQLKEFQVEDAQRMIEEYVRDNSDKEKLSQFFYRVMTDPTKVDRLNLVEILGLVCKCIETQHEKFQKEIKKRLFEEAIDSAETCTTGYVTRILNVLSGYVEGREMVLRLSPKDELRSAVFARLNASLRDLCPILQEQVLESMTSENKFAVEDFITFYGPDYELWKEYETILQKEEFDLIIESCYNEYKGL